MKRINSIVMLVAAVAMAFISCQKQEMAGPDLIQVSSLTFSSEKPSFNDEAKTEWTGETIQWSDGDKIRVAYTAGGVWQNKDGDASADEENGSKSAKIYASEGAEAGETASFSVPKSFEAIPTGVDLEFYGVYPSTASGADMPYAPSVTVTIPAQQKPLANSFDSKADLMAARSVSTYILSEENPLPEAIPLMWTRLVAHGYFTLKNLAVVGEENIKSIVLTANDEADMVGQHYLYLDTYNVVKPSGNTAPNKLTIDASNLAIADGSVSFWACFLPCTWTSVTVQVETDKATYTREIDLSTNQKTFAKNARNTLGINMATATRVEKEVSVGTLPFVRDFSEMTGIAVLTELDGFTLGGYVCQASGAIRLAKNEESGTVTTQALDLSKPFHVIVSACGWDSDELALTVSAGEQTHNVVLQSYGFGTNGPDEFRDYALNFSAVGNSETVSFEAAKKVRCFIQKIQVLDGHVELPSTLSATAPDQISADGGEGSFTYTLTNPKDGIQLTVSEDADWITDVVAAEGIVTYTVAANDTEDPREADITLAYGELNQIVTVSQKGQTAAGVAYYEKVTSAPVDWSGTYLLVCENAGTVFSGISTTSTKYGLGKEVTINSGRILADPEYEGYQIIISKATVTSEAYVLSYGGKYLYWGSGNSLNTNANESTKTNWTINVSDGNAEIANVYNDTRRIFWNSSDPRFACYDTDSQSPVQLYKLITDVADGDTPNLDPDEGETWTLTITTADLKILNSSESSTYNKYKGVQTATAYNTSDNKEMEVQFYIENVMTNTNRLQFKAEAGLLYTKTSLGTITSTSVALNDGSAPTVTIGSVENPSNGVEGGSYLSVKNSSSKAAYYDSITITYKLN